MNTVTGKKMVGILLLCGGLLASNTVMARGYAGVSEGGYRDNAFRDNWRADEWNNRWNNDTVINVGDNYSVCDDNGICD